MVPARALLLLLLAVAPVAAAGQEAVRFERSELVVVTDRGRFAFTVELATTKAQQEWGLTGRESLAPDAGMLFVLATVRPVNMWMKEALIPLDMLFADAEGRIVTIEHEAAPRSTRLIPSGAPVRAVLEVGAGTARRLGIKAGDRLVHPVFAAGTSG